MVRHLRYSYFLATRWPLLQFPETTNAGTGSWAKRRSSLLYIEVSAVTSTQHAWAFFLVVERIRRDFICKRGRIGGGSDGLDGDRTHVDAGERQDPEQVGQTHQGGLGTHRGKA